MPQVGCYVDRCNKAREREQPRFAASLALVNPDADRFYLVDATPDITRQLDLIDEPRFRTRAGERRPFDGIFLTHAHIGHYAGLAVLGREGLGMAPTPTYCTERMAAYLRENGPWELMVREGRLDLHRLRPALGPASIRNSRPGRSSCRTAPSMPIRWGGCSGDRARPSYTCQTSTLGDGGNSTWPMSLRAWTPPSSTRLSIQVRKCRVEISKTFRIRSFRTRWMCFKNVLRRATGCLHAYQQHESGHLRGQPRSAEVRTRGFEIATEGLRIPL